VTILRELRDEGVGYIPIDPERSNEHWQVVKGRLVGPLSTIKGVGPAKVRTILDSRETGAPLPPALHKMLSLCKTTIDTLTPVKDAVDLLLPDKEGRGIISQPTEVAKIQPGVVDGPVLVFGIVTKIAPLNENELARVIKRKGRRYEGPTQAINMQVRDDSGSEIFCKVDRYLFTEIGEKLLEQCHAGKSLYAIKGMVPRDFRMIRVEQMIYIGEMDKVGKVLPPRKKEDAA
jgi:hypothetical protein